MHPKSSISGNKGKQKVEEAASDEKTRFVDYTELQDCDKYVFDLNSDCLNLNQRYTAVIEWIRRMCSQEGAVIRGIPEARSMTGCPLLELKVTYKQISTKILIAKSSVYVIGYNYAGTWYCFTGSEIKMVGCVSCENSRYESPLCTKLGAKAMLNALFSMQFADSETRKEACEVFFVHFAEAARFRAFQNKVNEGILLGFGEDFDPIPDWELRSFKWFQASRSPDEVGDIMKLISPGYTANFHMNVESFDYATDLVHNWGTLSEAWCSYCATERMDFDDQNTVVFQQCEIRNMHALKNLLGLLCCVDLEKVLKVEEKRLGPGKKNKKELSIVQSRIEKWKKERAMKEGKGMDQKTKRR